MARDNTMRFTFSNVTAVYTVSAANSGTTAGFTATSPATAPANNTPVYFNSLAAASGGPVTNPIIGNVYYVVSSSGATFGLAPVPGGTAITIASTGTATGLKMFIGNLSPVSNSLGTSTGAMRANLISNQWSIGYSDALNVGRFRDQQADQSQIATINSVVSSITGDPAVFGSTAQGSYFLRASVTPLGMFGPNPCQIIVQGNVDAGTGVAPAQTDTNWLPVSSIGVCATNAGGLTFTSVAATSGQIPSSYIGTAPTIGGVFMATGGGGITVGTPYVVASASSGAYTLLTGAGATFTPTAAFTSGLVGNFGGRAITLVANASVTGNLLQADIVPSPGDAIVLTAVTATTLSANTLYFVASVTTNGLFTVSTTFGGAAATVTAVTSGTGITYGFDRIPIMQCSSTVTSGVFTSTSVAAGSVAVPHGLQVGSLVALMSGTSLTGVALDGVYYVNSVPSATTFTISATQGGATITTAAVTTGIFAVGRSPKIVNVQIGRSARPYLRACLVQQNSTVNSGGYFVFNYADLSVGKDSAQVP